MGRFSASAETVLDATTEEVCDFVSAPRNWPRTFRGSAAIDTPVHLPLRVGDVWTEVVAVGGTFSCRSAWSLITAARPRAWVFQQVDAIGAAPDGSGGVDGITTISSAFTPVGADRCLVHRSIDCELPRGVTIPDPLLLARAQPATIEHYQEAVEREIHRSRAGA